jgi:hypothetical protein
MADDLMQKSPAPGLSLVLSLCGSEGIEFKGKKYVPDFTKGYFQFQFSHAYPILTAYGTGLHPNVVARSYKSLEDQNVNYEHQIAEYHKKSGKDVRDRVIGSIVAVDFPQAPVGGWKVNPDPGKAPGITGVAAVFKQAQGMVKVMGEHSTGRHKYTVSMECLWPFNEAGWIAALKPAPGEKQNGSRPAGFRDPDNDFTPTDLLACGVEYYPFDKAPADLVATFSRKSERVVAQWHGRKCGVLMGGLDNPVHYAGAGVVHFGAERTAKIMRLAASGEDPYANLADALLTAFRSMVTQKKG